MQCPRCRTHIESESDEYCRSCGLPLKESAESRNSHETGDQDRPDGVERPGFPWETSDNPYFLPTLYRTMVWSLSSPTSFFRAMPLSGGFLNPLLYALPLAVFGGVVHLCWSLVFGEGYWLSAVDDWLSPALSLALLPVQVLAFLFLGTAWYRLIVGMTSSGSGITYEALLRISCYTAGPSVFYLIPYVGAPIALVWGFALQLIGFRYGLGMTWAFAVVTALSPLVVCCVIVGSVFAGLAFLQGLLGGG